MELIVSHLKIVSLQSKLDQIKVIQNKNGLFDTLLAVIIRFLKKGFVKWRQTFIEMIFSVFYFSLVYHIFVIFHDLEYESNGCSDMGDSPVIWVISIDLFIVKIMWGIRITYLIKLGKIMHYIWRNFMNSPVFSNWFFSYDGFCINSLTFIYRILSLGYFILLYFAAALGFRVVKQPST